MSAEKASKKKAAAKRALLNKCGVESCNARTEGQFCNRHAYRNNPKLTPCAWEGCEFKVRTATLDERKYCAKHVRESRRHKCGDCGKNNTLGDVCKYCVKKTIYKKCPYPGCERHPYKDHTVCFVHRGAKYREEVKQLLSKSSEPVAN
jgi:hypothetical protein